MCRVVRCVFRVTSWKSLLADEVVLRGRQTPSSMFTQGHPLPAPAGQTH